MDDTVQNAINDNGAFDGQLNLTVSNGSRHFKNEEGVNILYVVPSLAGFTFLLNILPFYLDFA